MLKNKWPVFGHHNQVRILQKAISENNLAHAYLIYGPRGLGKKFLTDIVVREVLGLENNEVNFFHQDVLRLPVLGKKHIAVEDIRQAISFLSLKHATKTKKFLIIDRAETMTLEASNALLKSLEEPPNNTHIFLLAEKIQPIPVTIQSRCQLLKLNPLSKKEMETWISQQSLPAEIKETVLKLALGRPGRAKKLIDSQLEEYNQRMDNILKLVANSTNQRFALFDNWLKELKNSTASIKSSEVAYETEKDLEYLELLFRDMIFKQLGHSGIINSTYNKDIDKLTASFDLEIIQEILVALNNLRAQLKEASNVQLAWENFLLKLPSAR